MNAQLVVKIYTALAGAGIQIWIDGGWCVSALLGRQIRRHSDLDITVAVQDVPALRELLNGWGFRELQRPDSSSWMFVLGDPPGNKVDVHAIELDSGGRGILGPVELGQFYPAGALTGEGVVEGTPVKCIAPEAMLKFKTSYAPREADRVDVAALCAHFGFAVPGHWP